MLPRTHSPHRRGSRLCEERRQHGRGRRRLHITTREECTARRAVGARVNAKGRVRCDTAEGARCTEHETPLKQHLVALCLELPQPADQLADCGRLERRTARGARLGE